MLKVRAIKKRERRHYVLRWNDPETGVERQRTTRATTREQALKEAGAFEAQLREKRYDAGGRVKWSHARQRFEAEILSQRSGRTREKYISTLSQVEKLAAPKSLNDLDASRISVLQRA